MNPAWRFLSLLFASQWVSLAHDLEDENFSSPSYDWSVSPPTNIVLHFNEGYSHATTRPTALTGLFAPFSPQVHTHWDDYWFYVESDGMPAHPLMVGITAWQRQVPLPQTYTGRNAWRFPLQPVPAPHPVSARTNFFRGAIAIAVNGIPIFNPIKNDGRTDTFLAGELDQYGGHAGRADDYHYHVAPLHLQKFVGSNNPIAMALDGYPVYGLNEPDGQPATGLDEFNGHSTPELGYHYHASKTYPYLNGGFHGVVTVRGGQVDPQPSAHPVRAATYPLPGATITGFARGQDGHSYTVTYNLNGQTRQIRYGQQNGSVRFDFIDPSGQIISRVYPYRNPTSDVRPDNPNPPPRRERVQSAVESNATPTEQPIEYLPPRTGAMTLMSPAVGSDGRLPMLYTGDGAGISPPLAWSGEPKATKYFAVIMHHVPGPGDVKWYWTLYNLPAQCHALSPGSHSIGLLGNNSVNRQLAYAPPHSKGPGAKTYILTIYALSGPVVIHRPAREISRNVLLAALKDLVLDSAELRVTYDRTAFLERNGDTPPAAGRDDFQPLNH